MENHRNWAGNYRYSATELYVPEQLEQVKEKVASSSRVKVLGSRHSFNGIADTDACHISLEKLNRVIELDRVNYRVTVEGGIRYGELGRFLHEQGYALHNLASLPHISVAGAIATATHGSGDRNGNLATAVHALELVKADGETVVFSRDQQDGSFEGAVVGIGALGVVTRLTLNVVPTFHISQTLYEHLPLEKLQAHFDDIYSSAYSVSLFTDWKDETINQVWLKQAAERQNDIFAEPEFYGAKQAADKLHPVPGVNPENCSEQMGVPGPWCDRLPHFRMEFTPSAGEELQSEYFVARKDAYEALLAIDSIRDHIAPHLLISEIRTIAADDFWMSPNYKQASAGFHFTWKPDWEAVRKVLPLIEEKLAPFQARPHWGKLFTMQPELVQSRYEKLPEFRELIRRCDPHGKFGNEFLEKYIY
ncbi:FAD-binding protein [Paenibacillus nanensis]|uniref:FAD-binding protein n=1 Tax=Paenibacillus nanensis TaxID=393251 RepID=A0A3A1V5M4_9BACL|nr:FAD-binding protein [Paenibacillus nanensis]RIX53933.1 FAD-binding protein [Paenibacillus nanensis]